jgi:hypothetical protein
MTPKTVMLLGLASAALALPAGAMAQQDYGQRYDGQPYYARHDDDQRYDRPRGDWEGQRYGRIGVYREFAPIERHIQREIHEGVENDSLEPDDARDLMGQLRQIQLEERREYRVHGWDLPDNDRFRIRAELGQLDRLVDQTRAEP